MSLPAGLLKDSISVLAGLLEHPFTHAFGRALLHSLWQGAGLAALLAATLALLRGRSANARYAVACCALALMLLLPLLTIWGLSAPAPGDDADESSIEQAEPRSLPAPEVARAVRGSAHVASTEATTAPSRHAGEEEFEYLLPWLALAWLLGVSVLSVRMAGGAVFARRLERGGVRPAAEAWQARLRDLSRRMRVNRPVRLLESQIVRVPAVVGWLRPAILLPSGALMGLTPQQLEAVIAHELAHVRRHDYLVNLLQTAAETLLFYHPAAWWVSRQVRVEREHVCDDMAVAATGDALTYARALAQLERARKSTPRLALAADGGSLRTRVLRLVSAGSGARRTSPLAVAAVFVVSVTATAVCARAFLSRATLDDSLRTKSRTASNDFTTPDGGNATAGSDFKSGFASEPAAGASPVAKDFTEGEDAEVRRVALAALAGHEGSVVVMNPQTGQVYAVVNQEWALRRGWTPASTMKLVTSIAGLSENVFDPEEKVRVPSKAERLDLTDALAISDNGYFKLLAARVGAERMVDYARRLGLGAQTGINYEAESAGRLPSPRSVASVARLGFGEGVEVTPVQLAALVSAIANGGRLLVPRVAGTQQEAATFTPQPFRRLDVSSDALARVAAGMRAAVERGTASGIKDASLKVAGKTGTFDGRDKSSSMGLFASYAPSNDPRLVVVVLTRGEGESGPAAARIAGSIYEALRGRM